MNQAVYIGDATATRTGQLATLPAKATAGASLRGFSVMAEASFPSNTDFWLLRIGRAVGNSFESLYEVSFQGGFPPHPVEFDLGGGIPVSRGDVLLWRVIPQGDPEPLAGLSIVPDWGTLGARR